MKKDVTMNKNSFVKGAFVTTIGIIIAKLLGAFYVIPFHSFIGEAGGALYGYAYTIYNFFISIATAGLPFAISKLVSEYQTLGYRNAKMKVFLLGKKLSLLLGLFCFLFIFLTAPFLSKVVLGNIQGGNHLQDVTFVIRVIGSALLIVPLLSVYRGYFEGHRFMSPPSISQVVEQIVRVLVILIGSYMALRVFHWNLRNTVGIALFGATVGALVAYVYLVHKKLVNKSKFQERLRPVNEPIVTESMLFRKIIYYAVPFIIIDLFKSLYSVVDMFSVVRRLVGIAHYSASDAEMIYSMLSTWSNRFNMVVLAISSGVVVSLIPNLTDSVVKKDEKGTCHNIIQAISMLLFLTMPITLGISFLAEPIWSFFYGKSMFGPSVLSYNIFIGLFVSLFTAILIILQVLKEYKTIMISLIGGFLIKLFFNYHMVLAFSHMNLPPYYGFITASIVGYLFSIVVCLSLLKSKYQLHLEEIIKYFIDILCGCIVMIIVLFIMKLIFPFTSNHIVVQFLLLLFYSIVGAVVYFSYTYFVGVTNKIFGKNTLLKIRKIIFK